MERERKRADERAKHLKWESRRAGARFAEKLHKCDCVCVRVCQKKRPPRKDLDVDVAVAAGVGVCVWGKACPKG